MKKTKPGGTVSICFSIFGTVLYVWPTTVSKTFSLPDYQINICDKISHKVFQMVHNPLSTLLLRLSETLSHKSKTLLHMPIAYCVFVEAYYVRMLEPLTSCDLQQGHVQPPYYLLIFILFQSILKYS